MILRRRANGKYFDYFSDREEAKEYIEGLIRTYRYHPHPETISIKSLVAQAAKQGINIDETTFSRWLKGAGITIRTTRPKEKTKHTKTFTMDKELGDILTEYPNQSLLVEIGVKLVLNLFCEEFVWFPDHTMSIILSRDAKGNVTAQINGEATPRDKIMIRKLMKDCEMVGDYSPIIAHCEEYGQKYFGGDIYEIPEEPSSN